MSRLDQAPGYTLKYVSNIRISFTLYCSASLQLMRHDCSPLFFDRS